MPNKSVAAKPSHAPSVFASEITGFTSLAKLSRRETDIVVALIRNITNSEEIAKALGISTHTVNNHLKSIFEKTTTKSKTEILSSFLRYAADRLQNRSIFVRRPRVLVIDPEQVIADYIAAGLQGRGLKTYTLTSAERAAEYISTFNIDAVVCDVGLPNTSGIELLEQVRVNFRASPYFFFVTSDTQYSLAECLSFGASDLIEKPLDLDRLFSSIMGHLSEAADERATLLQLNLSAAITITDPISVGRSDVGLGGVFLPLDAALQKKYRLTTGSVLDVTLAPLVGPSMIKARGFVVWRRVADEDKSLVAGVGLKYLALSDRDQGVLDELLAGSKMKSVVPLGLLAATEHAHVLTLEAAVRV